MPLCSDLSKEHNVVNPAAATQREGAPEEGALPHVWRGEPSGRLELMLTESKPDADSWIEAQGKKVYGWGFTQKLP